MSGEARARLRVPGGERGERAAPGDGTEAGRGARDGVVHWARARRRRRRNAVLEAGGEVLARGVEPRPGRGKVDAPPSSGLRSTAT